MDKKELLEKLVALQSGTIADPRLTFRKPGRRDPEVQHSQADDLLIEFIDDPEIKAAYDAIEPKWYA